MDYDKIIAKYRSESSRQMEAAKQGSIQQHTYKQIIRFIDEAIAGTATTPEINTPLQRGFMVLKFLDTLAQNASEPEQYQIARKYADDFQKETGLPWLP